MYTCRKQVGGVCSGAYSWARLDGWVSVWSGLEYVCVDAQCSIVWCGACSVGSGNYHMCKWRSCSHHYTTLHYTTPHCTTLHYTIPHCTTLHHTALHYTTLHHTTQTSDMICSPWKMLWKRRTCLQATCMGGEQCVCACVCVCVCVCVCCCVRGEI
jgi:hypothetical protein